MKRFYLIFTCLLSVLAYCEAESAVQAKTRLMAPRVVIKIEDGKAVLSWSGLPGKWYYQVLVSETSDMTAPEILASTADTVYSDLIPATPGNSSRFYAIVAFRAGHSLDDPEYVIIESFAEPVLLDSYSLEEDLQPEGWQWVEDGAGSEDSISLELFGNTWKRQAIVPKQTVAHEVWQLVIRSLSISRIQAFGIADSANEMWYQIWGTDAVDAESWNASYVGWYPMDEWVVLDLPVAEDWYGRFGYFPCVLEMLYANDNDEMDPPGAFRIDEIRDLSPMIREPQPLEIEWSVAGIPYPDSVDIALSLTGIDEENPPVDFEWTLGDGSLSNDTSFVHRYATNESYRVVLRFRENDGLTGWVTSEIVCGSGSSTREFTFITVGDVMIARRYETQGVIDSIGADGIFDPMRITIQSVDLAMCNLECPFTNWPYHHPTKEYTFKGRPEYLPAIPNAGFDYCALGNNHNLDYMYPGMEETQFLLDSLGMLSSGSGANDLLAREPAVFSKNGLSAAILSYCNRDGVEDNLQPFLSATRSRPGFALWNRSQIEQTIPAASDLVDLVIVQSHSGIEYATESISRNNGESIHSDDVIFELIPDTTDVDLRRYALDMGADIVINHHPHVIQGIETYNGKFIAHSMGNFAFDQTFPETFYTMALRTKCSLSSGITGLEVLPLYIQDYVPVRANGYLAARILDYISELSRPMSTVMIREPDELIGHVVLDTPYNPRAIVNSTAVALEPRDTVWISEPVWIASGGYPMVVRVSDTLADVEVRVGRAIFWMGNFEEEGADPWLFNSDDESYSEENPHSGNRCALITRPAGAIIENGTLMTYRVPINVENTYTAQGWISTVSANQAALNIRYYDHRTGSVNLSSQVIGDEIDGTTPWTFYWEELAPHANALYYNIWFAVSGQLLLDVEARFDDIELVQWEPWQPLSAEIPFPSNVTHAQIRSLSERDSVAFMVRVQWLPTSSTFPIGG